MVCDGGDKGSCGRAKSPAIAKYLVRLQVGVNIKHRQVFGFQPIYGLSALDFTVLPVAESPLWGHLV